jgi:hypothetical protein
MLASNRTLAGLKSAEIVRIYWHSEYLWTCHKLLPRTFRHHYFGSEIPEMLS